MILTEKMRIFYITAATLIFTLSVWLFADTNEESDQSKKALKGIGGFVALAYSLFLSGYLIKDAVEMRKYL